MSSMPLAAQDASQLFVDTCGACHQPGGVGQPGLAPPLAHPELWTDLGDKAPDYIAAIMIAGYSGKLTAKGETYHGLVMPPQSAYSDDELASLATYVLKTLNGLPLEMSAAQIAAARTNHLPLSQLKTLRKAIEK